MHAAAAPLLSLANSTPRLFEPQSWGWECRGSRFSSGTTGGGTAHTAGSEMPKTFLSSTPTPLSAPACTTPIATSTVMHPSGPPSAMPMPMSMSAQCSSDPQPGIEAARYEQSCDAWGRRESIHVCGTQPGFPSILGEAVPSPMTPMTELPPAVQNSYLQQSPVPYLQSSHMVSPMSPLSPLSPLHPALSYGQLVQYEQTSKPPMAQPRLQMPAPSTQAQQELSPVPGFAGTAFDSPPNLGSPVVPQSCTGALAPPTAPTLRTGPLPPPPPPQRMGALAPLPAPPPHMGAFVPPPASHPRKGLGLQSFQPDQLTRRGVNAMQTLFKRLQGRSLPANALKGMAGGFRPLPTTGSEQLDPPMSTPGTAAVASTTPSAVCVAQPEAVLTSVHAGGCSFASAAAAPTVLPLPSAPAAPISRGAPSSASTGNIAAEEMRHSELQARATPVALPVPDVKIKATQPPQSAIGKRRPGRPKKAPGDGKLIYKCSFCGEPKKGHVCREIIRSFNAHTPQFSQDFAQPPQNMQHQQALPQSTFWNLQNGRM